MTAEQMQPKRGTLYRTAIFAYGAGAYVVFLATFLYAIGFIGNFGVPTTLDAETSAPWTTALAIDAGLLSLFALQHSIMARKWFKRAITKAIPAAAERSTYVLASSLALIVMFWKWEPIGGSIWTVDSAPGRALMYCLYAAGWTLVLVTTFVINHFDLFGLRQVWREAQGRPQAGLQFVAPVLYRIVRHPLYVGWLMVFWSTPDMTASHLLFAVMTTGYILAAIRFEEADLIRDHREYAAYRRQVPMLLPRITRPVQFLPADSGPASGARARATSGR